VSSYLNSIVVNATKKAGIAAMISRYEYLSAT
jgi:hypothetical protein